jgi:voltage-dependent calcium channel alpha-2/delta-3
VGKFLGSVETKIMHLLMTENIYNQVTIYDYQAVCYEDRMTRYEGIMDIVSSANTIILSPIKLLWNILWILASNMWHFVLAVKEYIPNCKKFF